MIERQVEKQGEGVTSVAGVHVVSGSAHAKCREAGVAPYVRSETSREPAGAGSREPSSLSSTT